MTDKPTEPEKVTMNRKQRLYVLDYGKYFTCLGFDVCHERNKRLATEMHLSRLLKDNRRGSMKAYQLNRRLSHIAFLRNQENGFRSKSELTPQLIGLEGKRVEVITSWGEKARFYVGKSTGFLPCHLEIANSRSTGGPAVMGAPFKSVVIIR